MKLHGPLTRYVKLQVAHAPGMPGTFSSSPIINETASKRSRHPSRHVRRARVVMHVGITNPRWPVKRSRHSRRMYNPQSLRIWREAHGIHGSRFTGQSTVYSKLNMEPISLNIFHRNSNTVKTKFSSNLNYGGKCDCETGPKMTTTKASKLFIAGRFCGNPELFMMTSSNGNISRFTGLLCGEFTGHWWISRTKASDGELWCFLWSAPWINGWVNNRGAGDSRRHRAHYAGTVSMSRRMWSSVL